MDFTKPRDSVGKTILLVEDNLDNRVVYATILRHHGFDVLEAEGGEEGINVARTSLPALILMDISIPGIDGWQATRILKADPATRDIPILALTAHAHQEDRERAMDAGCDEYLVKPCPPKEVVAAVRAHLGMS